MTPLDFIHSLIIGTGAIGVLFCFAVLAQEFAEWRKNRRARREQEAAKQREAFDLLNESAEALVLFADAYRRLAIFREPADGWKSSSDFMNRMQAQQDLSDAERRVQALRKRMGNK